jgi:WD40 repeat protein
VLRHRLARRGLARGAAQVGTKMTPYAATAAPSALAQATLDAALPFALGQAPAALVSANVAALVKGVTRAMLMTRVKIAVTLLLACTLAAGAGTFVYQREAGPGKGAAEGRPAAAPLAKRAKAPKGKEAPPRAILKGHTGAVLAVAVHPDPSRRLVASGSADHTAKVWEDWMTGQEGVTLKGHTGPVTCIAFSPDGSVVATGSTDKTVRVWTVMGRLLATLEGHTGPIRCLAWVPQPCKALRPDAARLITGSDDKTVKVWDVLAKEELVTLTGHTGAVTAVAFTWDVGITKKGVIDPKLESLRVVSGSADKTARLWDAVAGKELFTFKGHKGPVTAVAVSPDLLTAATASADQTVKVWGLATLPKRKPLGHEFFTGKGHTAAVRSVAYSGDGRYLATGSDDKALRVWGMTPKGLKEHAVFRGHQGAVTAVAFGSSVLDQGEKGERLVIYLLSGSADKTLQAREIKVYPKVQPKKE